MSPRLRTTPVTKWVSPAERDRRITSGFVGYWSGLPNAEARRVSRDLNMRMTAMKLVADGSFPTLKKVATSLGLSERTIRNHFHEGHGLFAFPPPELAQAIAQCAAGALTWPEVLKQIYPLFEALEANVDGRELLAGLAAVHSRYPEMARTDGYFAAELQAALGVDGLSNPRVMALIGYFTESLRSALVRWSRVPEESLLTVHRMLGEMLRGGAVNGARLNMAISRPQLGDARSHASPMTGGEPRVRRPI